MELGDDGDEIFDAGDVGGKDIDLRRCLRSVRGILGETGFVG